MRILQVSTYDKGGGAEAVAWQLFDHYRRLGHQSAMVVGEKSGNDPHVISLSQGTSGQRSGAPLAHISRWLGRYEGRVRGVWRIRRWLDAYVSRPQRWWQARLGRENFDFPETWKLLDLLPERPDILHCHNLHGGWLPRGGYFDLSALPWLSRQIPTVMTLHDTWMLAGHCAYTLGCERWKAGCGHCPDLSIYPAISRDATAFNWKRKREIFAAGRFYIATPSRWLMRQVEQSMLSPGMVEGRVIANGVDSVVFSPGCKASAREALGLPPSGAILLFVANAARSNVFKDYRTVEQTAIRTAAGNRRRKVMLLVVGETGEPMSFDNGEIRFVGYQRDQRTMAQYYQAADVYVHAAKSDTFPNTVLEALACGVPVVATAVDGIPEQIDDGRSGFLVPAGDPASMAARVMQLLSNDALRLSMSEFAATIVSRSFTVKQQVEAYLEWYEQLLSPSRMEREPAYAC
jgi:glycosyltransferase involved in cell wall biosynthesis